MHKNPEVIFDLKIPMRDGVKLSADVYGAVDKTRKPAILFRTPYGKESDIGGAPEYFASHGYVFVASDVRGRGDSDGEFSPYQNEGFDGYDAIEWICNQDWSNGMVATWGPSYCGRIQWYTAVLQPPGLRAMIPVVSPSDPFVEDPTGLPSPLSLSWDFLVSGKSLQNTMLVDWDSIYTHLPLSEMDGLVGRSMPHWHTRLEHQFMDDFNRSLSYQQSFDKVKVPVLHVSGWYDDEQIGTPLNFLKMTESGDKGARSQQSLLMGPWGHRVNKFRVLGEFDFGPEAVIDLLDYERKWLDSHLKSDGSRQWNVPVRAFVMGSNKWQKFQTWPPESSSRIPIYLTSGGSANSRFGDGELIFNPPGYDSRQDNYTYNPRDPVPFIADQNYAQIGGPDDYAAIERRDDVLVYTTSAFDKALEVIGPVSLSLEVSTNCEDTDFTGKLLVVTKNNKAIRLCDGVTRLSRRSGHSKGEKAVPKKIYQIEIDMWNTSYHWNPGERLRLEVSSSAFPKYARNLNVFGDQSKMSKSKLAEQSVYHGKKHGSALFVYVTNQETGRGAAHVKK